jgi:enoyl-[acyl-carrier-protein] reductase (NADH)
MVKNSELMKGKRGLIIGVANNRSIAWGRFPLQQRADAPHRHDRGSRRQRALSALRPFAGVTGQVHHVDSGYHVVGMKRPDAPDISLA